MFGNRSGVVLGRQSPPAEIDTREDYLGWWLGEECSLRFEIRRANGFVHSIAYGYMTHYVFDDSRLYAQVDGLEFLIEGRHLRCMFESMGQCRCWWVQEYSPQRFRLKNDFEEPVIERVIVRQATNMADFVSRCADL